MLSGLRNESVDELTQQHASHAVARCSGRAAEGYAQSARVQGALKRTGQNCDKGQGDHRISPSASIARSAAPCTLLLF